MNKHKYILLYGIILLVVICVPSIYAPDPEDYTFDGSELEDLENTENAEFYDDFVSDPVAGFQNDPAKAWETLYSEPSLMNDPQMLDAAFNNDRYQATTVINQDPSLLLDSNVLNRFDAEIQTDITILQNNPEAQSSWLREKFSLTDQGAKIKNYDGNTITTKGTGGMTFNAKDFPESKIRKDGCLETTGSNVFCGSSNLESTTNLDNGRRNYVMDGGTVTLKNEFKTGDNLFITNGNIERKKGEQTYYYEGSFIYSTTSEGEVIESFDEHGFKVSQDGEDSNYLARKDSSGEDTKTYYTDSASDFNVKGKIIVPTNSKMREFILVGSTTLEYYQNPPSELKSGNKLEIKGDENTRVYYTEVPDRLAASFCHPDYSCVINTPGTNENNLYRDRLAFLNIKNNNQITYQSAATYFSHVEVENIRNGEINYISLDSKGNPLSKIPVDSNNLPRVLGNIEKTNAGRVDVLRSKDSSCSGNDCEQLLTHWSSDQFMKGGSAFKKESNHFVTCSPNKDCEKIFAENFGTIIGPKNKISTTIISSGDYAVTAGQMTEWCEKEGCYILNSRDTPPQTTSKHLIITGHHYQKNDFIWRDPKGFKDHSPIDKLYFSSVEGSSEFDHLPEGNVETIRFAGCNTVLKPKSQQEMDYVKSLGNYYPNLYSVWGYNGRMSPLIDYGNNENKKIITESYVSEENIPAHVYQYELHDRGITDVGERAWFVKTRGVLGDNWLWTNGKTVNNDLIYTNGQDYFKKDENKNYVKIEPPELKDVLWTLALS